MGNLIAHLGEMVVSCAFGVLPVITIEQWGKSPLGTDISMQLGLFLWATSFTHDNAKRRHHMLFLCLSHLHTPSSCITEHI